MNKYFREIRNGFSLVTLPPTLLHWSRQKNKMGGFTFKLKSCIG